MTLVSSAGWAAFWILLIGSIAVYFEVETVYCGVRVQGYLASESRLLDEVRRQELRYNELLSPDLLEASLPVEDRPYLYPLPSKSPAAPKVDHGSASSSGKKGASTKTPAQKTPRSKSLRKKIQKKTPQRPDAEGEFWQGSELAPFFRPGGD